MQKAQQEMADPRCTLELIIRKRYFRLLVPCFSFSTYDESIPSSGLDAVA